MAAACALAAPAASAALGPNARYELVHGCYGLKSVSLGRLVATDSGPFRMQATELGQYLFYGRKRDFLTAASSGAVQAADKPSDAADWRVEVDGDAFKVTLPSAGKALGVDGAGQLALVAPAAAGRFAFEPAQGCPEYPEVQVNATGPILRPVTPYSELAGTLDGHMHGMAFEFLGGRAHCGRPWHRWGVEYALVDCPDHYPNGSTAVLENVQSYGNPGHTHDPVGWPTFKDWPHHASLTHEQSYYKWLERAWRGGLRLYVNLLVDNSVLCEVYPLKQNSCNEMDSVRLQAKDLRDFVNYIDAQSGGPGKGFFQIVTDPFQARRVIAEGKLAVVMGIEVSKLFDCGEYNEVAQCDKAQIDRQLDEVYGLGVRDMELVNKFDNALAGVAGDGGTTGAVVNSGNKYVTGHYWKLETCKGVAQDRPQPTAPGMERDSLAGNAIQAFLPPGTLPLYSAPPHCNTRGLTALGEHLVRRMMDRQMIIDPDHLGVLARDHLLNIVESRRYSGIISSHSWSTPDALPRIYRLGGVVTPYGGSSTSFVKAWRETKPMRDPRFYFGFGYGADMGGFGAQGGPRGLTANMVRYPFKSFDGGITLDRQRSGQRLFDINLDGVAHYGLFPDWIEDLRKLAGDEIVKDMSHGAEAYVQMWERAVGVPGPYCHTSVNGFGAGGVGKFALRSTPEALLRRAGQPQRRIARRWRWCVGPEGRTVGDVVAVFTPDARVGLVASDAPRYKGAGVGRGALATRLRGRARPLGAGLYTRRLGNGDTMAFVVRRGRVRYVAVASPEAARSSGRLRAYLKLTALS
jgi:microsomal dipeptidase-like Zn-dependent dipeptidase